MIVDLQLCCNDIAVSTVISVDQWSYSPRFHGKTTEKTITEIITIPTALRRGKQPAHIQNFP
ncbi:hypothetical protein THIOM_001168 [Candidatus Thiomargarita nelsonii]|uniref:Uncharacterized protein n=1 Tax=Candidatus Thiomargarita nelsonii TaxID=1003181 RepID=A0A176S4X7_9GAMM|nr:hypothetical protein THIOM_001168 [Candidatus Thiomargarita nelsonii]